MRNALANVFQPTGLCDAQAVNRLANAAEAQPATPDQATLLLRALYAVRRSVWMLKNDQELAMLIPAEGCCLTRMDGTPVRLSVQLAGVNRYVLTVETKQPTEFTLSIHVPGYANSATLAVNGARAQYAECGKLNPIKRMFQTGDTIVLQMDCQPFVETGYRGSASVYCGPLLMALPLPDGDAAWSWWRRGWVTLRR